MNIVSSPLQFVQVDAGAVLIDSRVYCSEIICVNHSDWMHNVLYKHQSVIESRFGSIRFENGSKAQANGKHQPKPQIYALRSEPQCNFALSLSRNTAEVVERKADLIADFERAKATLRSHFEAQFTAPAYTAPTFSYPVSQLKAIAHYCTIADTNGVIHRDYVEGLHYLMVGKEMMLSEICLAMAINASRSRRGIELDAVPDIRVSIRDCVAHHNAKAANKQNARLARQSECSGQLSLQLG
jgi:hypothetical protein